MRTSKTLTVAATVLALISAPVGAEAAEEPPRPPDAGQSAATRPAMLEVGAPAPAIRAATWLNGKALRIQERGQPKVFVLTFWASWSGPSRVALGELVALHEKYHQRGVVFLGVTEEAEEEVRAFLYALRPAVPFRIALDEEGATTRAYCAAVGVDFVPYSFVIGPDRAVAWHGHPQQTELTLMVEQLLTGRYDRAAARELVRRSRSIDQLQALFRESYANGNWQTALLALDGLLKTNVPKQRLLRYKLSILLGELDEPEQARRLADELARTHAGNARFLNSMAWDVVSEPRLYTRDPEIALLLARAAYRAADGKDAAIADTYARALHIVGRVDLAAEVQARAVALASPEQRLPYERMLAFYHRCRALQAEATADP